MVREKEVVQIDTVDTELHEVRHRPINLLDERANIQEIADETEIEYVVHKERPIPVEQQVHLQVPRFNKVINETVLERPVKVLKIKEEAVPVETEVLVEIENKIEVPVYEEIVEEVPVVVDKEVVEYYDVIKEKRVEVEKVVDVELSKKTIYQRPVERYQQLDERVVVDRNIVVPVEGREINEEDVEVTDYFLEERIMENRRLIRELRDKNYELQILVDRQ